MKVPEKITIEDQLRSMVVLVFILKFLNTLRCFRSLFLSKLFQHQLFYHLIANVEFERIVIWDIWLSLSKRLHQWTVYINVIETLKIIAIGWLFKFTPIPVFCSTNVSMVSQIENIFWRTKIFAFTFFCLFSGFNVSAPYSISAHKSCSMQSLPNVKVIF